MARLMIPQRVVEESDKLFNEYMAQKTGPFSDDDLVAYVKEHGSAELLSYRLTEHSNELIK